MRPIRPLLALAGVILVSGGCTPDVLLPEVPDAAFNGLVGSVGGRTDAAETGPAESAEDDGGGTIGSGT